MTTQVVEKWIDQRYQERFESVLKASRLAWEYVMTGQGEKELTKAAQAVDWTPERLEEILRGYEQAKRAIQQFTACEEHKAQNALARIEAEIAEHQAKIKEHQEAIERLRAPLRENERLRLNAVALTVKAADQWPPDVLQEAENVLRTHFMSGGWVILNEIPREVRELLNDICLLRKKMIETRCWLEDDIRKIWERTLAVIREHPKR